MNQMIKLIAAISVVSLLVGCGEKSSSQPSTDASAPSSAPEQAQPVDTGAIVQEANKYREGAGVVQDSAKAFELYSKAAELGDRDAMFFLGVVYENGESVPVDEQKAVEWLTKSVAGGNGSAPARLKALKAKMLKK